MKSLQERFMFPVVLCSISAILIVLIWFAFFNGSDAGSSGNSNAVEFELQQHPESGEWTLNQGIVDTSRKIFDENGNWLSFDELLRYASTGEVNLVSELWALRRECPEDLIYEQCNEVIRAFIADHYSGKEVEYLMNLFSSYLKYEITMREFEFSDDLSNAEKYELIKKKRREFFSDNDAQLIFGLEEAEETYRNSLGGFLIDTESLNGEQRIQKYEEFRKNVYGRYYNTVKKRESKYSTYETEMFLREDELERMSLADRNNKTKYMREKYFGKDGTDRIDTVYSNETEERERKEK
ncbi:lipase secretion chaperone [Leptospira borgpetersenii]|uniref:lipase secretion chaperone n=1 Tax=Leptospira borgpetersenii TaxID=174 RepID=UPI000773812E|nr:lipase secretion chaperone [Leptospira borgpetersenii]